jgi:hypothetical protein
LAFHTNWSSTSGGNISFCTRAIARLSIGGATGNTTCSGTLTSGNISCPGITCTNSSTALYVNNGGTSIFTGKIGVSNLFPQSMLHLGNCEVVGSAPVIIFGKNTGGGSRNAFMGYSDSFFFVIGDDGNSNAGPNTQLAIIFNAPAISFSYSIFWLCSNGLWIWYGIR